MLQPCNEVGFLQILCALIFTMSTGKVVKSKKGKPEFEVERLRTEGLWSKALAVIQLSEGDCSSSLCMFLIYCNMSRLFKSTYFVRE